MNSMRSPGLAVLMCAAWLSAPSGALANDIYRFVDEDGRIHITDRPRHAGYKRIVLTWKGWQEARIDYARLQENRERFTPLIRSTAAEFALPEALLHAVILAESAYDAAAVSRTGAVGLMQLMPATATRYGVADRNDPAANVRGGTRYLTELLDLFGNDLSLALAAYNAGENAVMEHGRRIPPFPETQRYVRTVFDYYQQAGGTLSRTVR